MEAPSSSEVPLPAMARVAESMSMLNDDSLPPGWSSYIEPTSDQVHYYKEEDGQSSWEHPNPEFLSPEWSTWHDDCSKQIYYYNKDTACSQWSSTSSSNYGRVFMRMAISGAKFSVRCIEDSPVVLLQEALCDRFLPHGWTRRRVQRGWACGREYHYFDAETGCSQAEHPLGDITFRIMKEDTILRPGEPVHANTLADPYIAVIIKLPTLIPGSKHIATAAYDAADSGGYMSIAVGDEVEILAPAEYGASHNMHLKYYYGRVRDNVGWFAWDVFDSDAQADTPTD